MEGWSAVGSSCPFLGFLMLLLSKKLPDLKQGPIFDELFDTFMLTSVMFLAIMISNNTASRNKLSVNFLI